MTEQIQDQDSTARKGPPKSAVLVALGLLAVSAFMYLSIAYHISHYGYGAAG